MGRGKDRPGGLVSDEGGAAVNVQTYSAVEPIAREPVMKRVAEPLRR
jgi:hypothetical protein